MNRSKKTIRRRLLSGLLTTVCLVTLSLLLVTGQAMAITAQAAQTGTSGGSISLETAGISRNSQSSITISIEPDEWYVAGTTFRLYKVADLNDDLTFSPTEKFKDVVAGPAETAASTKINVQPVGITTDDNARATASQWMEIAGDLLAAVRNNQIAEDAEQPMANKSCTFDITQNTGNGAANAAGKGLGLYLIQGDTAREGNRTVTYQPILICIPQNYDTLHSARMGSWQYQIQSYVKSADPTYTSNPGHHDGGDTPDTPTNPSTPTKPSTPTNGGGQEGSTESSSESSTESTSAGSSTGSSTGTSESGNKEGGGSSTGHRNSRTGDESQLPLYLTVMAVAAIILLLYFLAMQARKRHEARQARAERKAEATVAAKARVKAEATTAVKAEGQAGTATTPQADIKGKTEGGAGDSVIKKDARQAAEEEDHPSTGKSN